jgi:hypothetical protein
MNYLMAGFAYQIKLGLKKYETVLLALLYVFISGYLVIHSEYINGEFYYYFFKSTLLEAFSQYFDISFSKNFYGSVNKIIFPLNFWFITVSAFLINSKIKKTSFNFLSVWKFFRYTIVFHFYILLSTYATEIVPGFSIMPGDFPLGDLIGGYRTFFLGTLFTLYYLFYFKLANDLIDKRLEWYQWSIIFSPIIHVYLTPNLIHLYGFCIAIIVATILIGREGSIIKGRWRNILVDPKTGIFFISLLSLFFRYKYASFFTSTGESLLIFNADGETYYNTAKSFFEGHIEGNEFRQAPLYSLYLSVFFHLFGLEPSSIFYSQALLGSVVPFIVYKILSNLKYANAGLIAAFLVATDPLCIHYSIAVTRSSPLLITLPLIILFCVNLDKSFSSIKLLILGSLMAATFYMGPETLPALFGVGIYIGYLLIKKLSNYKERTSVFASFLIGVVILCAPLNLIYFNYHGELILLGRNSQADHSSTFFYKKSPPINKMIEMGFNPIDDPQNSLDLFFQKPLTVFKLVFEKLVIELPGFLLDPENVYLAPIHLSMESFYGAHVQFYIYFFFILGAVYFLRDPKISFSFKAIVFGSILWQAIGTSIIIFGTNRFRAPIVPLNLVLVGYGIWKAIFFQFHSKFIDDKANIFPLFSKVVLGIKNNNKYVFCISFLILIGMTSSSLFFYKDVAPTNYKISNWVTTKGVNSIGNTLVLNINSGNAALIFNEKIEDRKKLNVSIPVCNFLIPEKSPFFIFGSSDDFLVKPRRSPRGCFEVNTEIPLAKSFGTFYIYFYSSENGILDLMDEKKYLMKFYGEFVPVRFFQKINFKNRLKFSDLNTNYQNYSKGGLAIGIPKIE